MASLDDVYGQTFQKEATQSRVDYTLNIIANNLSHRQFKFKLADANQLWTQQQSLHPQYIADLIRRVSANNKKLIVKHIDKHSPQINMLPELIIDTPVEYFLIIDSDFNRAYMIYMTPSEVHCY